jgi:hypothetical protein
MKPRDRLIYLADPLRFGVLELVAVDSDGTLLCQQLTTGDIERFQPHDVDLWLGRPAARRGARGAAIGF